MSRRRIARGEGIAEFLRFGPLAVTAIVLAILDKLLWLGAVFVALPSANLLLA